MRASPIGFKCGPKLANRCHRRRVAFEWVFLKPFDFDVSKHMYLSQRVERVWMGHINPNKRPNCKEIPKSESWLLSSSVKNSCLITGCDTFTGDIGSLIKLKRLITNDERWRHREPLRRVLLEIAKAIKLKATRCCSGLGCE